MSFNCTRLRAAVDNGALRLSPLYYDRGQQVAHSGGPHTESIIFNRGRSVAMWTFTGRVFHPAQRPPPVERAPASIVLTLMVHSAHIILIIAPSYSSPKHFITYYMMLPLLKENSKVSHEYSTRTLQNQSILMEI